MGKFRNRFKILLGIFFRHSVVELEPELLAENSVGGDGSNSFGKLDTISFFNVSTATIYCSTLIKPHSLKRGSSNVASL